MLNSTLSQDSFYSKSLFGLEDNSLATEKSTNQSTTISQSTSSSLLQNSIIVLSKKSSLSRLEEGSKITTRNSRQFISPNEYAQTMLSNKMYKCNHYLRQNHDLKLNMSILNQFNINLDRVGSSSLGKQINITTNYAKISQVIKGNNTQLSKGKLPLRVSKQTSFNAKSLGLYNTTQNKPTGISQETITNTKQLVDQTIKRFSTTKLNSQIK
jgi:hypothetical protein